jgi:hypothetical protein
MAISELMNVPMGENALWGRAYGTVNDFMQSTYKRTYGEDKSQRSEVPTSEDPAEALWYLQAREAG